MSVSLSSELSSPPSLTQESTLYSEYSPDEEPQTQNRAQAEPKTRSASTKSSFLKYPADIQRLTRRGLCTYGINTGPVPDDTDWARLTVPMLKEQLAMREMPDDGKKSILVERLENLSTYKPEVVAIRDAPDDKPFGPISKNTSSNGEKRFFVDTADKSHVGSVKKAMKEDMFVIKQSNDSDGGVSIGIRGTGPDTYEVIIGTKTSCTCSSITSQQLQTYNLLGKCYLSLSHPITDEIADVLTHVFRAPAELLPQRTLFSEEIERLIERAPKVRFTAAEASQDPSMSDGIAKSKDGKSCPVCFKDIGEAGTVCCIKCGNHTHSSCFDVYTHQQTGWALTCAVCQTVWSNSVV
ncbi:SAP domain-containing protein [Colletotrichum abscissum]|uniref:SAP domain-containing protein n=1 Tax=Colletotrichum abscissum TaxID=1671311 RepID=UPI0027D63F67|nr:SAP domain-containing protein [Colletotrichum abscissum]KAK1479439.1 SAP domain-containing protein [Colletotrichum abscissum]